MQLFVFEDSPKANGSNLSFFLLHFLRGFIHIWRHGIWIICIIDECMLLFSFEVSVTEFCLQCLVRQMPYHLQANPSH